jgi:hypothetical protein
MMTNESKMAQTVLRALKLKEALLEEKAEALKKLIPPPSGPDSAPKQGKPDSGQGNRQ